MNEWRKESEKYQSVLNEPEKVSDKIEHSRMSSVRNMKDVDSNVKGGENKKIVHFFDPLNHCQPGLVEEILTYWSLFKLVARITSEYSDYYSTLRTFIDQIK